MTERSYLATPPRSNLASKGIQKDQGRKKNQNGSKLLHKSKGNGTPDTVCSTPPRSTQKHILSSTRRKQPQNIPVSPAVPLSPPPKNRNMIYPERPRTSQGPRQYHPGPDDSDSDDNKLEDKYSMIHVNLEATSDDDEGIEICADIGDINRISDGESLLTSSKNQDRESALSVEQDIERERQEYKRMWGKSTSVSSNPSACTEETENSKEKRNGLHRNFIPQNLRLQSYPTATSEITTGKTSPVNRANEVLTSPSLICSENVSMEAAKAVSNLMDRNTVKKHLPPDTISSEREICLSRSSGSIRTNRSGVSLTETNLLNHNNDQDGDTPSLKPSLSEMDEKHLEHKLNIPSKA